MCAKPATLSLADRERVREQYASSANFDARVRIYTLYGRQPNLLDWTFERLRLGELGAGARVLEIGCGPANLWRAKAKLVPEGPAIALSDLSRGMLAEAARRLGPRARRFSWLQADAQALPLASESVDLVLASHMLYHVPDRAAALDEIRRVLRPGGRLVASTNDWTHHIETRELASRFALDSDLLPVGRVPGGFFDLETAAAELAPRFASVRVHRYDSALEATEAAPVMDYLLSLCRAPAPDTVAALRAALERHLALLGSFRITLAVGLFEAVRV